MKSLLAKFALVLLMSAATAFSAFAGKITGTIHNGTNNKPGAGLDVILIQLQGGMQPLTTVKSDAQGHFTIDRPEIGQGPMLLRVPYKGVNYHQPLTPNMATVNIEIFETTGELSAVSVTQHDVVVQPSGANLLVGEEYSVENQTQPPVAFFKADGTFNFTIPDGAQLNQVSAWSSAGMPVVQGTIDKGKNNSAIAFAFKPGKNGVRISYQMPYPSNKIALKLISHYATSSFFLVAPPTVTISGAGLNPGGSQDGYSIYGRDGVPANTALEVSVSGTAPPPTADAGGPGGGPGPGSADDSGNPSVNSRAAAPAEAVTTFPARLDSLKWILVGGFAALFALGIVYLWRRPPQVAIASNGTGAIAVAPPPVAAPVARTAPPAATADAAVASVSREVSGGLDELKDKLFRLELRHQAGTISDEDYARQRALVEQTLRELVRG
jgi:hypothetical protein